MSWVVWNYEYLYVNYVCMELVKFCMEKYRFLYTSMKTVCVRKSSSGLESLDIWFGTLSLVYGLGWKFPNSFLVRVELRRALRLLYIYFRKGLVAS